uniref:AlNc14C79G5231 protein n=1 Tax=Albugo laibachii Nc14 TaxID=890382 RepID=F0WF37_9STRA|nr:AlNc14C79G5231 [Albugo laibachii Nc14]|eukprot:CCA19819.1 AlNc14C79G5231 [Albugo laibachii Nc14]
MQKLSTLISAAAFIAATSAQVSVNVPRAQVMKRQEPNDSKNVLTRATALLNKNNAAVDNDIGVSRSNVLVSQNDDFKAGTQSGDIRLRGTTEDAEDRDQEQWYGYGYPIRSPYYRYSYRYWW